MITEPDIAVDSGNGLIDYLFFSVMAAALGLGAGLGVTAWLASRWAAMIFGY